MRHPYYLAYALVALIAKPLLAQTDGEWLDQPSPTPPASVETPAPTDTSQTPSVSPQPASPSPTPEAAPTATTPAPVTAPAQPQPYAPQAQPIQPQPAPAPAAWNAPSIRVPSVAIVQRSVVIRQQRRDLVWGVGVLALANVHWLDQPSDRAVSASNLNGRDDRYPGFTGSDITLGAMLELRYLSFIGVELDLFRQSDRGTGTIAVKDTGSLCFIPGVRVPYVTSKYDVTLGQSAWHVPLLLKLSIPRHKVVVHEQNVERDYYRQFLTLAAGPEFVFPETATLKVAPSTGLDYPIEAKASNYVMVTAALGDEYRLSDSYDIRLLLSLRGSYNPNAGSTAMKRGEYAVVDSNIVPIAYRSEWRYQAAFTLGLGWFF